MTEPKLRVELDSQIFYTQAVGGISRYFVELIREFAPHESGVRVQTPFRYVANHHLVEFAPERFTLAPESLRLRSRRLGLLNRLVRPWTPKADLVHHTYYLQSRLELNYRGAARVSTVYDMLPELQPELFPGGNPHLAKESYVAQCDGILCISETTRADLERIWGVQDKPVQVTPLAVTDNFGRKAGAPDLPTPYVLFVGRRGSYKNFQLLLDAFVMLSARRPNLHLVCVGSETLSAAELGDTAAHLRSRIHQVLASDSELSGIYQHAAAFVFPSRYEGFGLPILEAFTSGCPVVVADTPALVEVAEDAAVVVDPHDPGRLAEEIERLLTDQPVRAEHVRRGHVRVRDFSWTATAAATEDFYREVLASR